MDSNLALLAGVVIGIVVGAGAVFVWRYSERRQRGDGVPVPEPVMPPGAEAVLRALRSSTLVVDADSMVIRSSAPARALGVVQGDRIRSLTIRDLVEQVRRDGETRQAEFQLDPVPGMLPRYVFARVAPLSSRLTLVLVEDRTRERKVESIRRDFVANVSHELKTPIGALNLLAEAVAEASDDPETVERFAGRMRTESERLTRLVHQIIELSRLQGDELLDEPVEVDVAEVVRTTVERSGTDAEEKRIELVTDCEPGVAVLGDPDQIFAAVSNLVENAVAYSPESSRVAVTAKAVGANVEITVSDQGAGIPEAELDRIFERFYRVDPARARSTGGTGLGLSIVKHVAASHGGTVRVWSEPGAGSSFTLDLPAYARPNHDILLDDDLLVQPRTPTEEAHP